MAPHRNWKRRPVRSKQREAASAEEREEKKRKNISKIKSKTSNLFYSLVLLLFIISCDRSSIVFPMLRVSEVLIQLRWPRTKLEILAEARSSQVLQSQSSVTLRCMGTSWNGLSRGAMWSDLRFGNATLAAVSRADSGIGGVVKVVTINWLFFTELEDNWNKGIWLSSWE